MKNIGNADGRVNILNIKRDFTDSQGKDQLPNGKKKWGRFEEIIHRRANSNGQSTCGQTHQQQINANWSNNECYVIPMRLAKKREKRISPAGMEGQKAISLLAMENVYYK